MVTDCFYRAPILDYLWIINIQTETLSCTKKYCKVVVLICFLEQFGKFILQCNV